MIIQRIGYLCRLPRLQRGSPHGNFSRQWEVFCSDTEGASCLFWLTEPQHHLCASPKKSYLASNPFSWQVFRLSGDEPTQQPESTVLNHLEQKPRRGDFYGANFSQDERKEQALVWRAWKAALRSGGLSGGKKGRGAKVLFGDSFTYHCCNLDHLLQQFAPSTIQTATGQTQSLFTPVVEKTPRNSLHSRSSSPWYYRGHGFYKGQKIHFHSFLWPWSWLCKDKIYSELPCCWSIRWRTSRWKY